MRTVSIIGILVIVAGVAGLAVRYFTYTETERVVDVGPIRIESEEEKTVWIPQAAAIVAIVAGLGLVFLGRREA